MAAARGGESPTGGLRRRRWPNGSVVGRRKLGHKEITRPGHGRHHPAVVVRDGLLAAQHNSRRHSDPTRCTDMSIAAWPSIDPTNPRSAWARAASSSRRRKNTRNRTASATIMMGPPTNSATVNCQPISNARITPSSTTRLVEAGHRCGEVGTLAKQRSGHRDRRVGTRRRGRLQSGSHDQGARAVVAEQPHDRRPPHHRLHHRGERKPKDQRPGNLPGHRPCQAPRPPDRVHPTPRPYQVGVCKACYHPRRAEGARRGGSSSSGIRRPGRVRQAWPRGCPTTSRRPQAAAPAAFPTACVPCRPGCDLDRGPGQTRAGWMALRSAPSTE